MGMRMPSMTHTLLLHGITACLGTTFLLWNSGCKSEEKRKPGPLRQEGQFPSPEPTPTPNDRDVIAIPSPSPTPEVSPTPSPEPSTTPAASESPSTDSETDNENDGENGSGEDSNTGDSTGADVAKKLTVSLKFKEQRQEKGYYHGGWNGVCLRFGSSTDDSLCTKKRSTEDDSCYVFNTESFGSEKEIDVSNMEDAKIPFSYVIQVYSALCNEQDDKDGFVYQTQKMIQEEMLSDRIRCYASSAAPYPVARLCLEDTASSKSEDQKHDDVDVLLNGDGGFSLEGISCTEDTDVSSKDCKTLLGL